MQLEELHKQESFTHIDESGLPMQGKNWWLWVIFTANIVIYRQSHIIGHTTIKDFIEGFQGTIIAVFFSAYKKFDDNDQQKCLAHLLSDVIELIVGLQKENEQIERKIQKHEMTGAIRQKYLNSKKNKALKSNCKFDKKSAPFHQPLNRLNALIIISW